MSTAEARGIATLRTWPTANIDGRQLAALLERAGVNTRAERRAAVDAFVTSGVLVRLEEKTEDGFVTYSIADRSSPSSSNHTFTGTTDIAIQALHIETGTTRRRISGSKLGELLKRCGYLTPDERHAATERLVSEGYLTRVANGSQGHTEFRFTYKPTAAAAKRTTTTSDAPRVPQSVQGATTERDQASKLQDDSAFSNVLAVLNGQTAATILERDLDALLQWHGAVTAAHRAEVLQRLVDEGTVAPSAELNDDGEPQRSVTPKTQPVQMRCDADDQDCVANAATFGRKDRFKRNDSTAGEPVAVKPLAQVPAASIRQIAERLAGASSHGATYHDTHSVVVQRGKKDAATPLLDTIIPLLRCLTDCELNDAHLEFLLAKLQCESAHTRAAVVAALVRRGILSHAKKGYSVMPLVHTFAVAVKTAAKTDVAASLTSLQNHLCKKKTGQIGEVGLKLSMVVNGLTTVPDQDAAREALIANGIITEAKLTGGKRVHFIRSEPNGLADLAQQDDNERLSTAAGATPREGQFEPPAETPQCNIAASPSPEPTGGTVPRCALTFYRLLADSVDALCANKSVTDGRLNASALGLVLRAGGATDAAERREIVARLCEDGHLQRVAVDGVGHPVYQFGPVTTPGDPGRTTLSLAATSPEDAAPKSCKREPSTSHQDDPHSDLPPVLSACLSRIGHFIHVGDSIDGAALGQQLKLAGVDTADERRDVVAQLVELGHLKRTDDADNGQHVYQLCDANAGSATETLVANVVETLTMKGKRSTDSHELGVILKAAGAATAQQRRAVTAQLLKEGRLEPVGRSGSLVNYQFHPGPQVERLAVTAATTPQAGSASDGSKQTASTAEAGSDEQSRVCPATSRTIAMLSARCLWLTEVSPEQCSEPR
jgi:hypothetical protein